MFPLWVKKLTAFVWLLACIYGAGYFLGRMPSTLPEYILLSALLFVGVCLAATPLVLTWIPQHTSASPNGLPVETQTPHAVSCNMAWDDFFKGHEDELKELAALPRVAE